ncbi:MAG: hypothetical protein HY317_06190 [Acidobacteria bacterium]|nr:hypothetical protein [Acidobacteriota bacterium]
MDEPFVTKDGRIEVAEIMRGIRDRIRQKRDQGLYTDEELEEMILLKLQAFGDEAEIHPELLERLLEPSHAWNISVDYRIESHRAGLPGRVIVFVKKLVAPFVRLYTDHVLNRQAQLNLYMVHVCHNLVRQLTRLQVSHAALKNRCDRLEEELRTARTGGSGEEAGPRRDP